MENIPSGGIFGCKWFPAGMKHRRVKPDRKPFANSFLSVRNSEASSRIGNFSQIVSCR